MFPRREPNIPCLGTRHSRRGNNRQVPLQAVSEYLGNIDKIRYLFLDMQHLLPVFDVETPAGIGYAVALQVVEGG